MWVELLVTECDFTGRKYANKVKGAGAIAKGATGRACVVMWAGPEYLKERDITPLSYEDAVTEAESRGWKVDF